VESAALVAVTVQIPADDAAVSVVPLTVQLPEGKTEVRTIQVGLANDQQTEITGGLVAGERVIIPSTTVASIGAPGGGGPGGGGGPPRGIPGGRD
jgi:hypothetical protein